MHDKDKLESVPVKAKEDSKAKVELDKRNITNQRITEFNDT